MTERIQLWKPRQEHTEQSELRRFQNWVAQRFGTQTENYLDIWRWSVEDLDRFWDSIWEYFEVIADRNDAPVRSGDSMPGVQWYPGAQINYAENILRHVAERGDAEALVGLHESGQREVLTWNELAGQVGALAQKLRSLGVQPGDRVCAVLPNLPQTVVAMFATAAVGAVWSVVNTDFGTKGIRDRFEQIEPKVLFTVDGYQYNGKHYQELAELPQLLEALPTVQHHILVENQAEPGGSLVLPQLEVPSHLFTDIVAAPQRPEFTRVEFSHPLWVLYSSGTTGKPKGIVHSHGGVVIEGLKANSLQHDLTADDRVYFCAATTWVMWNLMIQTMFQGATVITYDGAPAHGAPDRQLQICAQEAATLFGTGAAVLAMIEKSGVTPAQRQDLSALKGIFSSGSPLPESTWKWCYEHISADMKLGSESGGTDVMTGFIGSNPYGAVYQGELIGPYLAVDVDTFDESGTPVVDEVGELVIKQPMPSMPVFLWGDDEAMTKYRETYFDQYPGVWRQGDWATRYEDYHFVIHGRSDSTINRGGIRMGSADICQVVDEMPEVQVSMVLGIELGSSDYYMPMFVVPKSGHRLDDALKKRIVQKIREDLSPRYIPDELIEAPEVPRTRTGKLMEVPVKKVFQGKDPATVDREAAVNPETLEWYLDFAHRFAGRQAVNA